jgi:hypothetical protein
LDNKGTNVIRVDSDVMVNFSLDKSDSGSLVLAEGKIMGVFVELRVLLQESSDDGVGKDKSGSVTEVV